MGRGYQRGSGQFRIGTGRFSDQRKIYEHGGLEFMKSNTASNTNQEVVFVSVAKLNALWKKDKGYYIPKGGGGESEIKGRREDFQNFLKKGIPIEMSRVDISKNGNLSFGDGRHRFSVFRDMGKQVIPVTTDRGAPARRLKRLAGVKPPKKKKKS